MAIFTTTSTSGIPPAKYFKDARVEIERCAKTLDELAVMIGLWDDIKDDEAIIDQ